MIYFIIALAVIALLILLYLLWFIRPRAQKTTNEKLLCNYAHRGLHGKSIPENSIAAFELACQRGYGIELDVQLSKDGKVMVFHDYTLNRMTGMDGKVCETEAKDLTKLKLKNTALMPDALCFNQGCD